MTEVRILADGCSFPEGPAFGPDGTLWFVDIEAGELLALTDDSLERYLVGGGPNGLAFDHRGRAWVCDQSRNALRRGEPETGEWETVVESVGGTPLAKPNDLAFGPGGTLVFTCPGDSREKPTGYVCRLGPDRQVERFATGLYFPNGLCFADGGDSLIVAETYRHRLCEGDWEPTGPNWKEVRPWAEVGGPIGPDGLAVGADGLVYAAVFDQGNVAAIASDGSIVERYDVPGSRPTNVAFDPSGRHGLVVTEAEHGRLLALPNLGPGISLFDGRGV